MDTNRVLVQISCKNGLIGKFAVDMMVHLEDTWIEIMGEPAIWDELTETMKNLSNITDICGIHSSSKTFEWRDTVAESIRKNFSKEKRELKVCVRKKRIDKNVPEFAVADTPENEPFSGLEVEGGNLAGPQIDMVAGAGVEYGDVVKMEHGDAEVEVEIESDEDVSQESEFGTDSNFRGLSPTPTTATSFYHDNIDHERCEMLKDRFQGMANEQVQYLIDGYQLFVQNGDINRQMKNDTRYPQLTTFLRVLFQENSNGSAFYDPAF